VTAPLCPNRLPWTIPRADGPIAPSVDAAIAGVVAVTGVTIVVGLAGLAPDARGHGTHEQLGWDACGWPRAYGYPCPTCGCTTAACAVVHGRLIEAFVVQPFGAVLALSGIALTVHAIACLVRGRSFADLLVRLPFWRIVFVSTMLLFASWAYKAWTWPAAG
jgi:hypothetical protein